MLNRFSLLAIVFFLTLGCKTKKAVVSPSKSTSKPVRSILKTLSKNKIDKTYFRSKAKLNIFTDDINISASSKIKMIKDSVIWINAKKFGLEVGRVLITKDSITILNRLSKDYMKYGIQDIGKIMGLPNNVNQFINLSNLQNILLGNPIFPPVKTLTLDDSKKNLIGISKDFNYTLSLDLPETWVKKMQFNEFRSNLKVNISYQQKTQLGDIKFSYGRDIRFSTPDRNLGLEVKFSDIEFVKPKSINFEIPKNYKRID